MLSRPLKTVASGPIDPSAKRGACHLAIGSDFPLAGRGVSRRRGRQGESTRAGKGQTGVKMTEQRRGKDDRSVRQIREQRSI